LRNCYKTIIQSLTDWSNWSKIDLDATYFGLIDYCRNSDSETVTVFSYNPIITDKNYILAGNTENNDPSIDWNNKESVVDEYPGSTKKVYQFDYCMPLKSGDYFFDLNEYELFNGGQYGDLYCSSSAYPWRPKQPSATNYYDYTKKSCT
jgi:hypothetical protein